jgi:hypothetical protein
MPVGFAPGAGCINATTISDAVLVVRRDPAGVALAG